jgi:hypothetical protein
MVSGNNLRSGSSTQCRRCADVVVLQALLSARAAMSAEERRRVASPGGKAMQERRREQINEIIERYPRAVILAAARRLA